MTYPRNESTGLFKIQRDLLSQATVKRFVCPIRLAKYNHIRYSETVSFLGAPLVHRAIASELGL